MISLAVVEDQIEDYELLKQGLTKFFKNEVLASKLDHYTSAQALLRDFDSQYDIIFMDIDLPGINGLDAAKKIREKDAFVGILFLTHLAQFALEGYEVSALDYIIKPVNDYSLTMKMKKALRFIKRSRDKKISLINKDSLHCFYISEIYFIEVISHHLIYHTVNGDYYTRGSLAEAETALDSFEFKRCNNCYLINLRHVQSIQGNKVLLPSIALQISRYRKKEFLDALAVYLDGIF